MVSEQSAQALAGASIAALQQERTIAPIFHKRLNLLGCPERLSRGAGGAFLPLPGPAY
jgi:hypothetical protein